MKSLPAPLQFIVNSNLWISIGAVVAALQTAVLLNGGLIYHPIYALIFGATALVYIGQRMIPPRIKQESKESNMAEWMQHNTIIVYVMLIISSLLVVYGLWFVNYRVAILLSLVGFASVAYAVPVFKISGQKIRLRDWGLFKPFLLGLVWALVTVTAPMLQWGINITETSSIVMFFERFCFIAAICIPFDIRDMKHDKENIVHPTLPIKFGVTTALNIARKTLLIHLLLAMASTVIFMHTAPIVWIAYIISYLFTMTLIYRCKADRPEYYYTFLFDGTIILQAAFVVGATVF